MLKEARPVYKVWLDGAIVAPEDAKVSVFTETAMRGANVYEGMRGYWSESRSNFFIWHVETHMRRLAQSMKIMRMILAGYASVAAFATDVIARHMSAQAIPIFIV